MSHRSSNWNEFSLSIFFYFQNKIKEEEEEEGDENIYFLYWKAARSVCEFWAKKFEWK
jgi:hypothetical protein